jgi:C4-dicarboxylate-specific signal transduction histidine kinase
MAGLFIILLAGLLLVIDRRSHAARQSELIDAVVGAEQSIQRRLEANAGYLRFLADDLSLGNVSIDELKPRLEPYLADHPELLLIIYADHHNQVRWLMPDRGIGASPGVPLGSLLGGFSPPDDEAGATDGLAVDYTGSFLAVQNEPAFACYAPVPNRSTDDEPGHIVFVYSMERLFRHVVSRQVFQRHRLMVVDGADQPVFAMPQLAPLNSRLTYATPLMPPGKQLLLQATAYQQTRWGWPVVSVATLCVALVAGMAWGMWSLKRQIGRRLAVEMQLLAARDQLEQRVRERTTDLAQTNNRLREESQQRREAEQRARQRQDQLAHVARLRTMGEMAGGLAHELNQPLGAISAYADGCITHLSRDPVDHQALRRALDEVGGQARRAGRIIHRLRQFIADRSPQPEPTRLDEMLDEVIELMSPQVRQAGALIHRDLPDDLPPLMVDRIQFEQVLVNLLSNALLAVADQPPERRRIQLTARRPEDGRLQLCLADQGCGVQPDQINRLFDPFFSNRAEGLGMGLSITRGIVEAHGGRIWAEPNQPDGLRIHLELPLDEETR